MKELAAKKCTPCKDGAEPLRGKPLKHLHGRMKNTWHIVRGRHLEREYTFKNFRDALAFTNKVGRLAEKVGHHPDIFLAWGKVKLTVWTHKINGLTENDFIFAAKVNNLFPAPHAAAVRS